MANVNTLFTNRTTDGSSSPFTYDFRCGVAQATVQGTFDGATVTIEFSMDGGTTWSTATGVTFTESGAKKINVSYGEQLRATVSAAGGATSVTVKIAEIVVAR